MKGACLALLLLILTPRLGVSQTPWTPQPTDSLRQVLVHTRQDTNRVLLLNQLANNYRFFNPDSSLILAQQAMGLAQRLNFNKGKIHALNIYGEARRFRGEFPQALEAQFNALQLSKKIGDQQGEAGCLGSIGHVYLDLNEYQQALSYLYQAKKIRENIFGNTSLWMSGIGYAYERLSRLDSALHFQQQAYDSLRNFPVNSPLGSLILTRLGIVHARLGHPDPALRYFQQAIQISNVTGDLLNRGRTQYRIAELYYTANQIDSSLYYARLAFANAEKVSQKTIVLDASNLMIKLYKANSNLDSAFYYQEVAMATKDSLYGREKFQQLQLLTLTQQQRQQELREKQVQLQRIGFISALAVFLLIALLLWRNIRYQKRTNQTLNIKNEQIETQRNTLEKTLTELKGTQSQLIQSEKMASLGELTAGIAHEIQNPLNFVNNFSEVNKELLAEMKDEIAKGNYDEVKAIANDVMDNQEKINQHGKKADAIVKGMLQHSRSSSSEKQPTDINKLADEYLRLCYHGLRAKDKDFNATLKTDYDETTGNINVIPQDIGRVILNLITNAFYAVTEKKKQQPEGYEPTISISTKKIGNKVLISVKDNGSGISPKLLDKIFQPFFTTKPTGQGTGLGLSLSYDIIKAHGGELKVKTKEGEGAEFVIQLPFK